MPQAPPRLVIVSNRLPITLKTDDQGGVSLEASPGGLATGLRGAHERWSGVWIGWPGDTSSLTPAQQVEVQSQFDRQHIVPVHLSAEEVQRFYEGFSNDLPFFSQLLLSAGRAVLDYGWLIALVLAATAAFGAYGLTRAAVRARLIEWLWRIPAIGERMKVYQLARLYRTVGMLLRAGIPVVSALDMVRDLLDAHLRAQLAHARILIGEGQSMSAAFGATGLGTPVALRMMAVGERSGDMGQMMERIACFHDDEMARFVDWFTRAFEPVLMAVLGIAIGLIVVLMYMPIFELAGSIQ